VAHEALIRYWPRLRTWLDANRQDLLLHQQLIEAARQWRKLDHDPGALLRGVRLEQSQNLVQDRESWITLEEKEFLDASCENARIEDGQAQRLKRSRQYQVILGSTAGLLVIGLTFVLWFNGFFAPRQMSGIFNVAVADVGEFDSDGQLSRSQTGKQVSQWAVNYLRETLGDDPNVEIWPIKGGGLDRTRIGLVTPSSAGGIATDINANLIYYGHIETGDLPTELILGFYIAPQFEYNFEDIQGSYSPGQPIRVADLDNPGPSVQPELEKQSNLIAWLALGLTQVQLGESEQALRAFNRAAEVDPRSAVVQFFIGRENLFLADRHADQSVTYRQAAEDAFQKAIELDDQYARAYIGLGSVYINYAGDLIDTALSTGQAVDPQASEWLDKAIETYQRVSSLNPDTSVYGNPVADVARMALGNAYRLQGVIAILQDDSPAALQSFEQAFATLDDARASFEISTQNNESHRRYLTQVHEHLGETYQWQGYAFELAFEYSAAEQAYKQALASYQRCIAQAENTPDRIIQDEIVGLYCQPFAKDTQERIESLNGGS
jgi:tetratricopeptide (TPR) repeat protein